MSSLLLRVIGHSDGFVRNRKAEPDHPAESPGSSEKDQDLIDWRVIVLKGLRRRRKALEF